MKAWTDLSLIPVPLKMQDLKLDPRGYPIAYSVLIDDHGTPHFRVIDQEKVLKCAKENLCSICGKPLELHRSFLGGPLSFRNHTYSDPPMHPECATYAVKVCPFLAAPKFSYSRSDPKLDQAEIVTLPEVSMKRPDFMVLGTCLSHTMLMHNGYHLFQSGHWTDCEIWQHGKKIT